MFFINCAIDLLAKNIFITFHNDQWVILILDITSFHREIHLFLSIISFIPHLEVFLATLSTCILYSQFLVKIICIIISILIKQTTKYNIKFLFRVSIISWYDKLVFCIISMHYFHDRLVVTTLVYTFHWCAL